MLDGEGDLRIDGVRTTPGIVKAAPGEHQFVVTRDGEVVWAEWVSLADHAAVRIAVPEPAACSTSDLGRAHVVNRSVEARGVLCGSWVAALPGARTRSVLVASCEHGHCGPLLEWSVGGPGTEGPEVPPAHPGRWPAWATWTIVGVGAAAAVGITLIAVGAFQSSTQTQFVNGGGVVR